MSQTERVSTGIDTHRVATAFSRSYGHFSVMLNEAYDIIWASETCDDIFGWRDPVGLNVIDLVHSDDLGLALESVGYHMSNADAYTRMDPQWMPEYSSVRLAHADGTWVRIDVTIFNFLADPEIGSLLALGRKGQDRTDLALAIDLLGTGSDVAEVLPVICRLIDRTFDSCRAQVVWWEDGVDHDVIAPDGLSLPAPPAELVRAARATGERQQIAGSDDAVWVVPIAAPGSEEVVGCLVIWCEIPLDLMMGPQQPVHQAVRLASLAIVDHHAKRALRWEASHDALTGLYNRAGFLACLSANPLSSALLYLDLDDFKPVNDRYGHEAGDGVLVEVGRRIGSVVRSGDSVGRLGGDEFAILCPALTDETLAVSLARRLIDVISRPFSIGGMPVTVGASVGIAIDAEAGDRFGLLRRADEALYQAKGAGKRRVAVAPTVIIAES